MAEESSAIMDQLSYKDTTVDFANGFAQSQGLVNNLTKTNTQLVGAIQHGLTSLKAQVEMMNSILQATLANNINQPPMPV